MKTKRQRFEEIASNRVTKVLDGMEKLAKCSNKNNYEYFEDDIKKMEKVLRDKLNETLNIFHNNLKKGRKTEFKF